jgi:hypothetical protein
MIRRVELFEVVQTAIEQDETNRESRSQHLLNNLIQEMFPVSDRGRIDPARQPSSRCRVRRVVLARLSSASGASENPPGRPKQA